jgi:hypothetical protein
MDHAPLARLHRTPSHPDLRNLPKTRFIIGYGDDAGLNMLAPQLLAGLQAMPSGDQTPAAVVYQS